MTNLINLIKNLKEKGLEMPETKINVPKKLENVPLVEKPGINLGIDETMDAVDFSISLANAIIYSFADGKLGIGDIGYFMQPFMKLPAALSGIEFIPDELENLDDEEIAILKDKVAEDLEIDDLKAMLIIKESINTIYSIYNLVKAIQFEDEDESNA